MTPPSRIDPWRERSIPLDKQYRPWKQIVKEPAVGPAKMLRPGPVAAGFQHWRRLLFLHWPVSVDDLRPLVPRCLSIDTYEGIAYVGLIPFTVEAARPLGLPPPLSLRFLETNVRTYVRLNGADPGVYFFSLDAVSLLAVIGARGLLGLPYFWAAGHESARDPIVDYLLRRRSAMQPFCRVRYEVGDHLGVATPGSLEHFLVERYRLHVQRGPTLWTVHVSHAPYPLHRARLDLLADQLVPEAGIHVRGEPALVHFSPGVDVAVYPPRVRPKGAR